MAYATMMLAAWHLFADVYEMRTRHAGPVGNSGGVHSSYIIHHSGMLPLLLRQKEFHNG